MMLRIVYFAQMREAIGLEGEDRQVSPGMTILALVNQLSAEDARYADAFSDRSKLRFALDQHLANGNALLDGARELAIFPPVTGG